MHPTVAVALSGGIDSLMAALLLKLQNVDLFGIHFLSGHEPSDHAVRLERLQRSASRLGIHLHVVDLAEAFAAAVVAPFVAAYDRGLTPNPCVRCNAEIKFGRLLEHARRLGATHLATGHYARLAATREGSVHLERAIDRSKDQSYFLARLTREQLRQALFPLGQHTKSQVRQLASEHGIEPSQPGESQDVCFIGQRGYADFLMQQPGFTPVPGPIVDLQGRLVGCHRGLYRYTVGQRRGLGLPSSAPYYVVRLEPDQQRLVVGRSDELACATCNVEQTHWHQSPPQAPLELAVRVRYRGPQARATVHADGPRSARLVFAHPQRAVTPGQAAVFYDGERVLGTGWIARQ
jgi:tRNA-specific 2-thiouridylase